jgi:ABC-type branched-subunit amino acid transport system permease subunit
VRQTGEFVWPIFGVPDLDLGGRPTVLTAMLLSVGTAVLFNAFLAAVVFRKLRFGSPLARLVASLGVMLYLIEVMSLRFGPQGATALVIEPILPRRLITLPGDIAVYQDGLWLAAIALAAGAVMWSVSRFTLFGLSTRAVAENERGALLLGVRADAITIGNWMIAGLLASVGMILAAPITRLSPVDTSLLVVPAIAAALVAGFRGLFVSVLAALGIGMVQSLILNLQIRHQLLPELGLPQGVPLVVILVVLVVRAGALPARGAIGSIRLPSPSLPRFATSIVLLAALAAGVAMWTGGSDVRQAVILSAIGVVTAMSVVVATGFVGQISLATAAFAGVSAFMLVKITSDWGIPFPWAPLLSAAVASAVGVVFALPALRVRGLTLAMATLAMALAIEQLLFRWPWFSGGVEGARIPPASLFGIDLDVNALGADRPRRAFGLMIIVVATGVLVIGVNLARSATARRFLAVRSNERAAAALGIPVANMKVLAFAISAFLAGLAGALTAYSFTSVSTTSFGVLTSVVAVAITFLAGIATPLGALIAGLLASGGVLALLGGSDASQYQFAINGVLLVLAAMFLPDGIAGRLSRRRRPRIPSTA